MVDDVWRAHQFSVVHPQKRSTFIQPLKPFIVYLPVLVKDQLLCSLRSYTTTHISLWKTHRLLPSGCVGQACASRYHRRPTGLSCIAWSAPKRRQVINLEALRTPEVIVHQYTINTYIIHECICMCTDIVAHGTTWVWLNTFQYQIFPTLGGLPSADYAICLSVQ